MSEADLRATAEAIHDSVITIDTHVDIPLDFATESVDPLNSVSQVNLENMRTGGLDAAFFIVFVGQNERTPENYAQAKTDAMTKFDAIHRMTDDMYPDLIELAYSADDVERIRASGKLVAAIGIENGYVIGTDLSLLERYHELGARYITLSHGGHNDISDSSRPRSEFGDEESEHDGISAFGERVIAEMNRLGIMVDVSHISKAAALDAIRLSRAPVIASHSNTTAIRDHFRNMDDETLLALKDSGGVMQTVALAEFVKLLTPAQQEAAAEILADFGLERLGHAMSLSADDRGKIMARLREIGYADVGDFIDHVDHAVDLIGIDHVGLSSDFGGGGGIIDWFDASETINVTQELLKRGYSQDDIEKLWGGNLLRVWREVEAVAAESGQRQTVSGPGVANPVPNILLIIGDDMGVETLASYGLGQNPPKTSALDELAREGVRFNNFWAQPVCSPTRATLMTGRYGFRTGIGRPVGNAEMPAPPEIPAWAPAESRGAPNAASATDRALPRPFLLPDEFTLPMALKTNPDLGYSTAAIGKWHLAGAGNGWADHPNLAGFDHFAGLMDGGPESYFAWNKVVNGEVIGKVGYTPTDKVDDAIAWLDEQGENPWFLLFAFNLGHTPLHLPPEEHRQSDYSDIDPSEMPQENWQASFAAMMEAMDTEIDRLLATLDPEVRENTYVIFMSDNGTYDPVVSAPFRHGFAKGTIYEGGVNVPLIITGPGIERGGVSEALVNSTDLFATIMEMAGVDPDEAVPDEVRHDSVSFFAALSNPDAPSRRDWLYADEFFGGFDGVETADYAMRGARYKLLRFEGREEFYDLHADPYEHDDLLRKELSTEQRTAYEALKAEILLLRSSE
tara:strand:- start:3502 stop:6060 length:2559 start_codon:yes stop_codon:yes gene_type:complete